MLQLISLWTLNKIFERAKTPLGANCKMIYINCLMYHFEKLDAIKENSVAFEIFDTELDYEKFEKHFVELHKAGLVIIKEKSIFFENHWGQFIDRTKLISNPDGYVNTMSQISMITYSEQLKNSIELQAHIRKNHKLTVEKYEELLLLFIDEQTAIGKTYNDYKDVASHFFYWVGKKRTNNPEKSKSKSILGMTSN
jgi:hypothetical protein